MLTQTHVQIRGHGNVGWQIEIARLATADSSLEIPMRCSSGLSLGSGPEQTLPGLTTGSLVPGLVLRFICRSAREPRHSEVL